MYMFKGHNSCSGIRGPTILPAPYPATTLPTATVIMNKSTSSMIQAVINTLHSLSYLILWDDSYFKSHLTDEKTKARDR